jgi:EmrB/QacA subfamily drug resistance transporter
MLKRVRQFCCRLNNKKGFSVSKKYIIAFTAALGLFMAVLDDTVVNVALSKMSAAFHTDLNTVKWVSTAYLLVQAAVIPAAGYLGSRFGMKRMYLGFLALFTVGSLLCGLSDVITDPNGQPYIALLIAARIIQGVGAGALFPLGSTIALGNFAPEERAKASGIVAGPVLIAPILGPLLGGWLTDNLGWQSIFFINLPVGLVAMLLVWRIFPAEMNRKAEGRSAFDYIGLALVMVGTVTIIYGFNLVSESKPDSVSLQHPDGEVYGWGYWPVWALIGAGLILFVSFVIWELRQRDPVMDVRLFKDYNFAVSNVISWFNAVVVFGSLLLLPVFFQQVRLPPLNATESGLAQVPQGLGSLVGVLLGSSLYNRLGPRWQVVLGLALLAISTFFNSSLTTGTNWYDLSFWLFLRGVGFSLTFVPIQTLSVFNLTGEALAKASSLFGVSRQIFSSVGTAIVITVFTQQTASHYAPVTGTPQQVRAAFAQAQTTGVNDVFMIITIGTIIVLLLSSILLPGKKRTSERSLEKVVS